VYEPVQVEGGPERWRRVIPGRSHTCGLDRERRAWCWGYNAFGQLGSATGPEDPGPSQVFGRHRWVALAVGEQSTCGLRDDHALWCWGDDRDAMVGAGGDIRVLVPFHTGAPDGWRSLSVGERAACAERDDGSRWCWGRAAFAWPPTDEPGPMRAMPDAVEDQDDDS
jgi:alpha-tubulin suppressor-like RCC1 family protein